MRPQLNVSTTPLAAYVVSSLFIFGVAQSCDLSREGVPPEILSWQRDQLLRPTIKIPDEGLSFHEAMAEIAWDVLAQSETSLKPIGVDGFVIVLNGEMKVPDFSEMKFETFEEFLSVVAESLNLKDSRFGNYFLMFESEFEVIRDPVLQPILPHFQYSGADFGEAADALESRIDKIFEGLKSAGLGHFGSEKKLDLSASSVSIHIHLFRATERDTRGFIHYLRILDAIFSSNQLSGQ